MDADPGFQPDELRALEERLLRAGSEQQALACADLLADGFVEFGSSGRVLDKDDVTRLLRGDDGIERELLDFQAQELAPGLALTTYRVVAGGASPDAQRHTLRSSIWRRRDDTWEMLFHQGTVVPPLPDDAI